LTQPFAFGATVAEMIKESDLSPEDFDTFEEMFAHAIGAVAASVVDKSYFSGIAGFFAALRDSNRAPGAIQSYMSRQASGLVPFASLGAGVNEVMDPTYRDAANMWESLQSNIPGLRQKLIPRRNVWGEPVKPQAVYGRWYDFVSPFYVSKNTGSVVDNELVRLDSGVQNIGWKTSFAGVDVNFHDFPKVLDEYRRLAGNELKDPAFGLGCKDFLDSVISGKSGLGEVYQVLSEGRDGGKAAWIKNQVSRYRKMAQDEIMAKAKTSYPAFYDYILSKRAADARLKMPAGMEVDLPPEALLPMAQ
jgi:hypothetical protein